MTDDDRAADESSVRNGVSNQLGNANMQTTKDIKWRILLDIVIVILGGIPLLILEYGVTPYRRGYFCDDDSIRLSYKDSTIPSVVLYIVGFFLPLISFAIIEGVRHSRSLLPQTSNLTCFGFRVHPLFLAYYKALFFFGFGCLVSQLFTDIGKYSVGRLRPHFLDVCMSNYQCPTFDNHIYIVDYHCSGNPKRIHDARLSFPSGHSSFSAFCMVYLALFLQFRFTWRRSSLLRPALQLIVVLMSYYTGLSRVSDHKHHWSDVLVGFAIGTTTAFLICFGVSDLYERRRKPMANQPTLTLPLQEMQSVPLKTSTEYV